MLFKSLLVRRLEMSGSLSQRDIEDFKYIYMNHIGQPMSQGVQKLTFLFHHCRVNKLHNLLHPCVLVSSMLSVPMSHAAAAFGSSTPSLFPLFLLSSVSQHSRALILLSSLFHHQKQGPVHSGAGVSPDQLGRVSVDQKPQQHLVGELSKQSHFYWDRQYVCLRYRGLGGWMLIWKGRYPALGGGKQSCGQ